MWLRDPMLPAQTVSPTPTFPIPLAANQTINEFDPGLRQPYVQSWSAGIQREIFHETVLEIRYVGNHSVGLWRRINLNETNIFENGFLNQFKIAQQNLAIAQAKTPSSVNFGNQGLPGQANVPILSTALGTNSDTTTATYLERGEAGASAYAIATNLGDALLEDADLTGVVYDQATTWPPGVKAPRGDIGMWHGRRDG